MEDIPEWFHGARLNFAENLLCVEDNRVALYTAGIFTVTLIFYASAIPCTFLIVHHINPGTPS